jgi:hypothetical protein
MKWAERNRALVAGASVLGSLAGLVFSLLDLKSTLKTSKAKKK